MEIAITRSDRLKPRPREDQLGFGKYFTEVFGSGTAAVISPVGEIGYGDHSIKIGDGSAGPITRQLFRTITDIQYGQTEAPAGWIEPVL